MQYISIEVPDRNDSLSRVVLDGKQYQIRFTWNDTGGFWTFGLYDMQTAPILVGLKLVPRFPLNLFCGVEGLPDGVFGIYTELESIGQKDFVNGKATFAFIPTAQ